MTPGEVLRWGGVAELHVLWPLIELSQQSVTLSGTTGHQLLPVGQRCACFGGQLSRWEGGVDQRKEILT